MISGVTREIAGQSHTFRMKNRAKRAIEQRLGDGIVGILQDMGGNFSISVLTVILAESMNDGAGAPIEQADDIVDQIGEEKAAELLGEVVEAAFPEASQSKNQPRADQKK